MSRTAADEPRWIAWDMRDYYRPPAAFYRGMDNHRFIVWAETMIGQWVRVYFGNNEERAHESSEFWDARVNTVFIDRESLSPKRRQELSISAKWDALFWRINNDPNYGKVAA